MTTKTIWVIDDDPIYQIIMKKTIQKASVFSSNASFFNGKEAIDSLKKIILENKKFPDLILLDIEMPILDGWGFMEEIVLLKPQINTKINIYISSSSIAAEDKERARNNTEILGYMSKPITLENLMEIASY